MNERIAQTAAMPARRRQRGFTLIEIIVSLAILALALTVLLQAFATGLGATASSERQAVAVLLARSLLERVGRDLPLVPGEQSGVADAGHRWTVRISRARAIDPARTADSPVLPFDIEVSVAPSRGRPITLTTLRPGPSGAGETPP